METAAILTLIIGLIAGVALGALAAWQILRARQSTALAVDSVDAERVRSELAQAQAQAAQAQAQGAEARAQAADARAEASDARAEAAESRSRIAEVQGQVSEAKAQAAGFQTQAAEAQAEAAEVLSQLASATAQRDAAIERAKLLAEDRGQMVNEFKVLSGETLERQNKAANVSAAERLKQTEDIVSPLASLLTNFNDRLDRVEKERVAMATDLRNQVQAVQNTGEHLRRETHALATALRKPHVRGHWGEMQLRRVAEYAGMVERCDFDSQTTTTTSADRLIRPDMRVNLSDGKFLFVDAKVPLSAFLEAFETEDEATRADRLAAFGRNVKTHVDQLSGKQYWKADIGTPEFVVMFLPNEQFLFAALEQVPDLHEYAATRDVVIATPNTLIAMLRAVAYGWRQAALADSAREIFALGRELHDRLGTMGTHIDKTGRTLTSAVAAYNKMVGSLETRVLPVARKFRDLNVTDAELKSAPMIDDHVRAITAEELVDDATQVEPMIGRRSKRTALPEKAELARRSPDLLDLVEPSTTTPAVPRKDSAG